MSDGTASAHFDRAPHEGPSMRRIGIVERAGARHPSYEHVVAVDWRASGHEIIAADELAAVGPAVAEARAEWERPGAPVTSRMKPLMDVVIAASALFLLAPVLVLAAIAVLISMGRPIFFRQMRPGYLGHAFELVKVRSMRLENSSAFPFGVPVDPEVNLMSTSSRAPS